MKSYTLLFTLMTVQCHLLDELLDSFNNNKKLPNKSGTASKIKTIYAIGDSYSDNGNLHKLTNSELPNNELYYQGRYSNGPVWVEYLSKSLEANLTDMAYAGATTDNNKVKAPAVPEKYNDPGCLQQVQSFIKDFPINFQSESSLITVSFVGNDLFKLNRADSYMKDMEICLNLLLETKKFHHLLITTSNAPELLPSSQKVPFLLTLYVTENFKKLPRAYKRLISKLEIKYPETKFYNFDLGKIINQVAQRRIPLPGYPTHQPLNLTSCLTADEIFLLTPQNTTICTDPNAHLFWDYIHPTTNLHKAIAGEAKKLLE